MEDIYYIYIIKNNINNKVYVGQSKNIKARWKEHINDLNSKIHYNYNLQNEWLKFGEKNFEFLIIDETNFDNRFCLELYYIKKYNSANFECGYNLVASETKGIPHNPEFIKNSRNAQVSIPILQIDFLGT